MRNKLPIISVFLFLSLFTQCQLPKPGGDKDEPAIGKKVYSWTDSSRVDPYYGGNRVVNAQVWYPSVVTDSTGSKSEYIPNINPIWQSLSSWNAGDYRTFAGVRTKAIIDNSISPIAKFYPVLIFSPSLGGNASYYTYYAEQMAEKGFIVVGVNHQYESDFVIDENQNLFPYSATFHDSIESLSIPDQITADHFREMKSSRMKVMAEDLVFCMDNLEVLNQRDFENRLDLTNIGAWGHSIGGGAAIYASILDDRIRAVLNMDGTPPTLGLEKGIQVPFMFLEDLTDYKNHDGYAKQYKRRSDFCEKVEEDAYRIIFTGIDHNSYLDINYQTSNDEIQKNQEKSKLDNFLFYLDAFFSATLNGTELSIDAVTTDSLEILVFN